MKERCSKTIVPLLPHFFFQNIVIGNKHNATLNPAFMASIHREAYIQIKKKKTQVKIYTGYALCIENNILTKTASISWMTKNFTPIVRPKELRRVHNG